MATWDCTPNGVFTTASFTAPIRTAMNTQPWSTTITAPSSFASYGGYHCLIGNGDGGLWLFAGQIGLFRDEDAAGMAASGTLTGTSCLVTVNPAARSITISGATTGNGTFTWTVGQNGTIFDTGDVGVGEYTDGSFGFDGTVSDVTYTDASATGDAALTQGAQTASGAGSIDVSGAAALTQGAQTASGSGDPQPQTGDASITQAAQTSSATGSIELQGAAALTQSAQVASATATGPQAMEVGNATVKQRQNANGPGSGTLTTDPIATLTGSVLVVFLARGYWAGAPDDPTDSEGNTWIAVPPGDQEYAGFPGARAGVWYCVVASGSGSHTVSATWGGYNDGGSEGASGDEVTISVVELRGVAELETSSYVERASAATIQGVVVTPSGPSITYAAVGGNGPTSQTHDFQPTTAAALQGWEVVDDGAATGDPWPSGYIQIAPMVLVDADGSGAGSSQNIEARNPSTNEGAKIFQAVFQAMAGLTGDSTLTQGAQTASGTADASVAGDAALTQGAQVATSGAGSIDVSGAGALIQAAQVASGTGLTEAVGSGALTQASDTASSTASIENVGEAALVQAEDTAIGGDGDELIGVGSPAQAPDVALGTSTITPLDLVGDGALQQAPDTAHGSDIVPSGPRLLYACVWLDPVRVYWEANMSDERTVRQGDTPKTVRARAFSSSEAPDLSGYTSLTFRMTGPAGAEEELEIEGTASGDADGYLSYTFTSGQLDVAGTYEAVFRGVDPSGEPTTFPESTNLRVVVVES